MKYVRAYFAWMTTFSLIVGPMGLEGCSTKGKEPATIVQQDPGGPAQAGVTGGSASTQQADQQQPGDQSQPINLPDVNLTPAGLDELLAPIALYPDPVLAVMLQAAVDPQQVMDGGNWLALDENNKLKEAALDEASKKAGFTPVMQALLHYPTVIDLMCQQFDWTKQLGAAYQADPKTVLDSVQRLRATAVDNGALKSSSQMKVDVSQQNGQQVVQLQPTDPKVVYVPQYNPQQVFSQTTTTTAPDGTTTTTTTTSGPAAPATSTTNTVVVQQQTQQSGVSSGTAVLIGLLSFGAGIAVGAAISNNNYYYPRWGYGGIYYGGHPYYPPPYYPHYHGGWGPSYGYHRPVHYGNTNIYINNSNNYYNRFNNNNNLNNNYKPMPVHYSNKPNGVYANSMGNQPGANKGVNYNKQNQNYKAPQQNRPGNNGNNVNTAQRPANTGNNINNAQRPGNNSNNPAQRPAGNNGNNASNWKGQTTYQGNKAGGGNAANGPSTGNVQARPGGGANAGANGKPAGGANTGMNSRPGGANPSGGNANFGNKPVDRGYGQSSSGARPNTGNTTPSARPSTGNASANRPTTQPASRPAPQQQSKPSNGAFGGASNASADRAASSRGRSSMGAPQRSPAPAASNQQAAPKKR